MLLVLDVSLNELKCKHALNNPAKTRIISRCLHLSAETPNPMLYRWIGCSDLIIYITFLYMKYKETLGQIPFSVPIPPSNAGTGRTEQPAAACLGGCHLHTPLIAAHVYGTGKGMWKDGVFGQQITLSSIMYLFSLLVNQPTTLCYRRTESMAPKWELKWLFCSSRIHYLLVFPHCSLPLESRRADARGGVSADLGGDTVEVWLWPVDTWTFYGHGRRDSDWRKIHPENELFIPKNERNQSVGVSGRCWQSLVKGYVLSLETGNAPAGDLRNW